MWALVGVGLLVADLAIEPCATVLVLLMTVVAIHARRRPTGGETRVGTSARVAAPPTEEKMVPNPHFVGNDATNGARGGNESGNDVVVRGSIVDDAHEESAHHEKCFRTTGWQCGAHAPRSCDSHRRLLMSMARTLREKL